MLFIRHDFLYEKYKKQNDKSKEFFFKKSPQYSYLYALNVKKQRLKDEKVFLLDAYHAYLYALNVIKGRLPEHVEKVFFQENKIKTMSYYYGKKIQKEEVYLDSIFYLCQYLSNVVKKIPTDLYNYSLLRFLKENHDNEHIKNCLAKIKNQEL